MWPRDAGVQDREFLFKLRVLHEIEAMKVDDEGPIVEMLTPSHRWLSLAS